MSGTGCLRRATSGQGVWPPWQMQQHVWLLILPKTRKSTQTPPGMSSRAECTRVLVAGFHGNLQPVKGFSCKICTRPSHTRCMFSHAWRSEVAGRSVICCSLSDVIFATSFCQVIPSGLRCWLGQHRSWSSWHGSRAEPRGAGGRASPCEHRQHLLCSSADRRLPLRQQRRLGALHRAGRDWRCRGNRRHRLRVECKERAV